MLDAESSTNLEEVMSSIQGKISILSVEGFLDVEADQLLRKKLKSAPTNVEIREILGKFNRLHPLAIELIATSLNREVLSLFELKSMDMRGEEVFRLAFQRLWESIDPFSRTLLYFVAYLDPPEARKIWILSYLDWINSETGLERLNKDLKSLTELSLLKEISDRSAYKMNEITSIMILEGPGGEKGAHEIVDKIIRFVDSRNFIPQPPFEYKWKLGVIFSKRSEQVSREQAGEESLTTKPQPRNRP